MFKQMFKKNMFFIIIVCVAFVSSLYFVYNNYNLYSEPIITVHDVTTESEETIVDRNGNEDAEFTQTIHGTIKNGPHKGKQMIVENIYTYTGAYDFEYKQGNDLFVHIDKQSIEENEPITGTITNIKRDKQLLIVGWVFFFTLLIIGKRQGFFATASLVLNIIILSFALDIYVNKGVNLLLISTLLVIIFTILSLLLVNGRNEKTYAAIVATIIGTFLSLLITFLAMFITSGKGLYYEEMQFLTRPYELVFIAGLFIGSLGAVMDVAISISAALFELYEKNKHISYKALKQSGLEIGKDIMGTMTNILFFAYVSGSIPAL